MKELDVYPEAKELSAERLSYIYEKLRRRHKIPEIILLTLIDEAVREERDVEQDEFIEASEQIEGSAEIIDRILLGRESSVIETSRHREEGWI